MSRITIILLLVCGLVGGAQAQQNAVQMSQPITPGHAPIWVTNGVIGDGGPSLSGNLTEVGITNTGTPFCINSAPITGPYYQTCLGANAFGNGGFLSSNAYGGAPKLPLTFNLNGVNYQFPFTTGGIVGPNTTTVSNVACWNNATGTLLRDCGLATPAQIVGSNSSPVTGDTAPFLVSPSGLTPRNLAGANVENFSVSGVATVPVGSNVTNVGGVGGFVTCAAPNQPLGGSSCVGLYGFAVTTAINANAWGMNAICTTTHGPTGQACLHELDVNYTNTTDTGEGLLLQGNSSAQPGVAPALSVGVLNLTNFATSQWTQGIFEAAGCCQKAIQIGASKPTSGGVGVNGGTVEFDYFNSAGAAKSYTFLPTPTSFNFASNDTSPTFEFGGEVLVAPTFGLELANGGTGLQIGALAASGTSIGSQIETFNYFDGSSAAQAYTLQATSTAFNFSGTTGIPNFQFGGNLTVATGFGIRLGTDAVITETSGVVTYGSGAGITNIVLGNTTATLTLGVANGGTATKYVCVDASSKIVVQTAAC